MGRGGCDLRLRYAAYTVALVMLWAPPVRGAEPRTLADLSAQWAAYYAAVYHVPKELVDAIIDVESGWNPYVVSDKGAVGLMQLMPETAYRLGVRNRFEIRENIRGGVAYLAWLIRLFRGNMRLAVAAYYAGEQRILLRNLAYSSHETYEYVRRVAAFYRARRLAEVGNESGLGNLSLLGNQRGGSDHRAAHSVETGSRRASHRR
jgi:soluble lytic murein transglycosylase-like protein